MKEYQNLLHPKEQYLQFAKLLVEAAPEADTLFTEQQVIDMYNQILDKEPSASMSQIKQSLPPIVAELRKRYAPQQGGTKNNLEALQSVGRGI